MFCCDLSRKASTPHSRACVSSVHRMPTRRRSKENHFAYLGRAPPVLRCASSSHPCRAAAHHYVFFFFFARFAHAVTRRGHPDAASVEHALPQNDSSVRACDFAGEIGAQHARLSVRKNTSLSGAWHKFNSCLPGGFLSLTVTSHGHTTGRRVTGC